MRTSIVHVIENALNHVDIRLVNHGRRVAHLTDKLLRHFGESDPDRLRQSALLALLHDIGAYKTEEIDDLARFEAGRVWEHSVYGYLFIKYFSPIAQLAPVLLFHHADCREITYLHPSLRRLAQCIHVADRADILSRTESPSAASFKEHFLSRCGRQFAPDVLDALFTDDWERFLARGGDEATLPRLVDGAVYDAATIKAFSEMLVFAIDFRSPQTVTHSVTCISVSEYLGNVVELDAEEKAWLHLSAMLHDIGKMGIPPAILNKPEPLTKDETAIIRQHIPLTKNILDGFFSESALRMATRHHERLDGSGYPDGLTADDLTTGQRLLAVADVFSALVSPRPHRKAFSKKEAVAALREMAVAGQIDPDITAVAVREYDAVMAAVTAANDKVMERYRSMDAEYNALLARVQEFGDGRGTGEIAT